ncbi:MAG TPA: sensor domain-containing diguanylate cyclase [Symbiobacteriaceae bacterium]|nr:sensor domain-containing diguanylate cyclase [Symbiobacteriaceae bacterium]
MRRLQAWFPGHRLPWLIAALIVAHLSGGLAHVLRAGAPAWQIDKVSAIGQALGAVWMIVLIAVIPSVVKYLGVGELVCSRLVASALAMLGLFVLGGFRSMVDPQIFAGVSLSLIYRYPWPVWTLITLVLASVGLVAVVHDIRRLRYERDNMQVVLQFSESVSLMGKDGVLRETVKVVRQMTNADAILLFLLDPVADVLRVAGHYHNETVYKPEYIANMINFPCPRGFGITGRVLETGEPYLSKDVEKDSRSQVPPGTSRDSKTVLLLPMKVQGNLIGVLRVSKMGVDQLSDAQVTICAILANHAAVALDAGNLYHEVLKASRTDVLTALGNGRAFREALEQAVRADQDFSLLMVDADCLKLVNDTFGHHAGDQLLVGLADHLRRAAEGHGQAYRYAGDEFLVLLPGVGRAAATGVAEQVRRGLADMYMVTEAGSVHTTVSIGIACYPADGRDAEAVMRAADKAMYAAKQAGKNRVELAS